MTAQRRFSTRDILILVGLSLLLVSAKYLVVVKAIEWKSSTLTQSVSSAG